MSRGIGLVCLTATALALAGCGGTTKTKYPPGVIPPKPPPPLKAVTYNITLASAAGGAPGGTGLATISVVPTSSSTGELCWRFSELTNVTSPTVAVIGLYIPHGASTHGSPLGRHHTASGCMPAPGAFLRRLGAYPKRYFISIHTAQYPGGAVIGAVAG